MFGLARLAGFAMKLTRRVVLTGRLDMVTWGAGAVGVGVSFASAAWMPARQAKKGTSRVNMMYLVISGDYVAALVN